MNYLISSLILGCALNTVSAQEVKQAKFNLIYSFSGGFVGGPNDLHEVQRDLFYGSTSESFGTVGGEIFSVSSKGAASVVHQFPYLYEADWVMPAENGQLFGSFSEGGKSPNYFTINYDGSHLRYQPTGPFGAIFSGYPFVIPAPDGEFYAAMGNSSSALSIVKVDLSGNISTVYSFSGAEGQPVNGASLLRGSDGSFYGINTLPNNGSSTAWIYRLAPQGQFTPLGQFNVTDLGPGPPLVLATDGTIYGSTYRGGANHAGQIYKIAPGGPLTVIATFPGGAGMQAPGSLFMADDGNLYGTTNSVVSFFFRVLLPSGKLEKLYADAGAGAACACSMLQGSDGKLYGVSLNGGVTGAGTVFSLDVRLAPPQPHINLLKPTSGAPGTRVFLWGSNFLGATSVTFNGALATPIEIPTSQAVFINVPSGATTGPVTIATPNGSFTTTQDFVVN